MPDQPETDGLRRPFAAMVAVVGAVALLPFLGDRRFYLADDTTGAWLPVSRRIGELLRAGESHLMDPEMWRGGNFVASARYGVWNPIALALDVSVLQLDDLAVVMLVVTLFYLLVLATGCFLLAREYGASGWPAALAGVVAATGGWTLWMDATWWTPHLASLAFTPFVWVAVRRVARGVVSPVWAIVAAALCITAGNPYSAVVVFVIVVGVAVEYSNSRTMLTLAGVLVSIGLISVFVYLPFQQTSSVGFRETGVFNNQWWSAGAGDLLMMSSPTATVFVPHFGRDVLLFPAVYLSWFALPLAPWLRWRTLWSRQFAGLAVFGGAFLVLSLGPSNVWFFRWPMRLLPYLYLPILIALALVVGRGVVTDRGRRRAAISGAIIIGGAYLSWADFPDDVGWHVVGAVVVGIALTAAVVVGVRYRTATAAALIVGTVAVLVVQLQWRPVNGSVSSYAMPTTASAYEDSFAGRYEGTVAQVASFDSIPPGDRRADGAFADLTIGSTYAIAGVEAVSAYSAIGFTAHDSVLCIGFDGRVCPTGFDRLFSVAGAGGARLVDLIGADTVVVQRTLVETIDDPAPDGWAIDETTDHVVVWTRTDPSPWPDGRLSDVAGPITVTDNTTERAHLEVVSFTRDGQGPAQLTFSRLAWPGYEATIEGRPILVGTGAAGLLTVTIPDGVAAGEVVLTWVPPFWRPSLVVLALGVLTAMGVQVAWWRTRRDDVEAAVTPAADESPYVHR